MVPQSVGCKFMYQLLAHAVGIKSDFFLQMLVWTNSANHTQHLYLLTILIMDTFRTLWDLINVGDHAYIFNQASRAVLRQKLRMWPLTYFTWRKTSSLQFNSSIIQSVDANALLNLVIVQRIKFGSQNSVAVPVVIMINHHQARVPRVIDGITITAGVSVTNHPRCAL
jgi:hypothetical protein